MGEFPGVLAWGLFFCVGGRDEWREGRTDRLPAGRLQGLSFLVVCWEGVGYQRCVGWLQGLSFLVVCREGMGIGAVVDALWGECGIGAVVDAVE